MSTTEHRLSGNLLRFLVVLAFFFPCFSVKIEKHKIKALYLICSQHIGSFVWEISRLEVAQLGAFGATVEIPYAIHELFFDCTRFQCSVYLPDHKEKTKRVWPTLETPVVALRPS